MKFEIEIIDETDVVYYYSSPSIDKYIFDTYLTIYMGQHKYKLYELMLDNSILSINTIYDDLENSIEKYSKISFQNKFNIEIY